MVYEERNSFSHHLNTKYIFSTSKLGIIIITENKNALKVIQLRI